MSKLDQLDREQLERIDRESLIELILVLQQQYGAQQELVQGAVCGLLCALIGPGVLSVPGSCGRLPRMSASAGLAAGRNTCTKPGPNLGTWPVPVPAP